VNPITLRYGVQTDVGIRRGFSGEPNEDAVFVFTLAAQSNAHSSDAALAIVADGVGGAAAGEVASRMAIETIAQHILIQLAPAERNELADQDVRARLATAITNANEKIIAWNKQQHIESASTLALALVLGTRAYIANLGDSRVYLYRGSALQQITHDHSLVAELIARGQLLPDEVYTHPQRNVILKALGDPSGFEFELYPAERGALALEADDQILLCSDGLWEMVRDEDIENVLRAPFDPQEACVKLVGMANAAGGADNCSVILLRAV